MRNDPHEYDYVVVGVGAAGSVVAAELSKTGAQVLIESGGEDSAPTIGNPSIWFYNDRSITDSLNCFRRSPIEVAEFTARKRGGQWTVR